MATAIKRGNSYKITVSNGYDIHGKQIRYHKTWTPEPGMTLHQIAKELDRQKVLFEEECNNGKVANGNIKLEAFAEQWFHEYAEPKLKTRTVGCYHQFEKRVYAALGHLWMDKITTRAVQKFILNLQEPGVNESTGKVLAPKTIKNYLSFVSSVFDYAITQGIVKENPCRGVALPTIQPKERDCYTLEEAQRFLELLQDEPPLWRTFFTLAIYTGFRRGELFGLEWKDIDFESNVIAIQRTSLYTKERGIFTDTPKTKSSQRSLKVPESVILLLRQYRAWQSAERLKMGDQWEQNDRLFIGLHGRPMQTNQADKWMSRFCEKTGMRYVNIHSFRHLNASLLINSGADIKTVSAALGHTQTSTTLNIYAHTFAQAQARAADAIADALTLTKNSQINTK